MGQFHLSRESATRQIAYACNVADRLPLTLAALAAGQIHPVAVKIIDDETAFLSPENVAKADKVLADLAQSKSFAQLRYAAHRLVLSLDPDSAQRRKDEARKYAHVRRFREGPGELAARLEVEAPHVTGQVQRLEKAGYAGRGPGPDNRRAQLIQLTPRAGQRPAASVR
jgi:DNA-binding MarR family transcriptional regulator